MPTPDSQELQRFRYWQGQMLRSDDFRSQAAIEAQLRWWHNRAIHNTYGVSFGLLVKPITIAGKLTAVTISEGLAYDCYGRELILTEKQEITLPADLLNNTTITLLIKYKPTNTYVNKNELSSICSGESMSYEQPDFIWKPTKQVTLNDGVPLTEVIKDKVIALINKEFVKTISRSLSRPHIASGSTIPGNTAWGTWDVKGERNIPITAGFQLRIDTSAAGFTEVPCYFAWLHGKSLDNAESSGILFEHIAEPSINSFVFRLWRPIITNESRIIANINFKNIVLKQGLYVSWIGIQ